MTKETLTKVQAFNEIANVLEFNDARQELIDFAREEGKRVEEANARRRGVKTEAQKENEKLAEQVEDWFENHADLEVAYDGEEIAKAIGATVNAQKISAVLRIVKNVEKVSKATFDPTHVGYKLKN